MMNLRTICIVTITVTILILVITSGHAADKYAFAVRSVYKQAGADKWTQSVEWKFVSDDAHRYRIFRSGHSGAQMILGYDADGRLSLVEDCLSPAHGRTRGPNGLMSLSWGHPVPFDDLNPTNGLQGIVKLIKTIDQTRFVYLVERSITPISVADAIDAGMIDPDRFAMDTDSDLTLIAVNYQNALQVRQLWKAGDPWWLYEETQSRRSWRLPSQTQN
ncbi:MAG: hypothetical protein CSA23_02865 [Deltaproteobacteria bacterium]|nr:MAG: hypothetical protein CSA23_02865 [Deltaproteobacteria bacterium]